MAQSKDRVEFTLRAYDRDVEATMRGAARAFNISEDYARTLLDKRIICRPSQFARFLIYREKEGACNSFKALSARLFTPETVPSPVDLSGNPRTLQES